MEKEFTLEVPKNFEARCPVPPVLFIFLLDTSWSNSDSLLHRGCVLLARVVRRKKQVTDLGPAEKLHNRMFLPEYACSDVLQWGHSKLTCHPGGFGGHPCGTTPGIFLWLVPCARSKSSNSPPAIFLNPLPIPRHH